MAAKEPYIKKDKMTIKVSKRNKIINKMHKNNIKSVYLIATRDLSNLWLQFFLSQNQGFMRLFEKTVLK